MSSKPCSYHKEWLADGHILCYRFEDDKPATVERWAADYEAEISRWPAGYPIRLLLDVRHKYDRLRPSALNRGREMARLRPDVGGRLAMLTAGPATLNIIEMCLRSFTNNSRQRRGFRDEAAAIAWLLEDV